MGYFKNYDVKEIIYDNSFQRIALCKNNDDDSEFYNNIIMSARIIDLIDTEKMTRMFKNVLLAEKSEDRAYIITVPGGGIPFEEYFSNKSLTMKEQLFLTENLLFKFQELEVFEDLIEEAIIAKENILVKDNGIEFNNILKFSQGYDISESLLIKSAGDYMHYIYTGRFIDDYNISDKLPPDIMKIIIRCYSNQYRDMNEVISAFKKSQTYSLVFVPVPPSVLKKEPEPVFDEPAKAGPDFNNLLSSDEGDEGELEEVDNVAGEIAGKRKFSLNQIAAIILIMTIPVIILIMTNLGKEVLEEHADLPEANNEIVINNNNTNNASTDGENLEETINKFFSQDLLDSTDSEYNAEIDFKKFYDGYSSLVIKNDGSSSRKTLFAVVDMSNEDLDYMKNRQVGLSMKLTSEKDEVEGSVIVEVIENGKISAYSSDKVFLNSDIWSLNQLTVNLGNTDRILLYFDYDGDSTVWIDGIEIDVLK
ncbi:hypothetical protein SAMN02745751_00735 [Dethiosulfatibacter aminovorans DSM 17477]|uniref:Uncharacterized protein n=1 Tax=Dethiosulfatibacter aminovorans DSM 17477 TaxID=1121476 RepID=A0A1M6D082_9FIRM|nr:hypothetical protein [Dethiosulfatibacter aminovorans]SHI66531.1 hypothetical protein SAMN02745751_00735 [Dethiosulfatibacter aminovorans DSM 17477]